MKGTTPARAMRLIAQLRLRRLWNMVAGFRFRPAKPGSRAATPAKRRAGFVVTMLVAAFMLVSLTSVASQSLIRMQCYLVESSRCLDYSEKEGLSLREEIAVDELLAAPLAPPALAALSLQLAILLLASALIPLSSKELAQADWDLEWLVTLPAKRSTLLWGRLLERTVVNPTGWVMLTPLCGVIAWYSGWTWGALFIGIAAALAMMAIAATVRTIADTGLRMSFAPSQLRNVQAVSAIIGMPLIYFAMAFGQMRSGAPALSLARAAPDWLLWTPPGLLASAINGDSVAPALAMLLAQVALILWAGMALLRYQLRDGVVASGARESSRTAAPAPAGGKEAWFARLLPRSAIKRRELRLLGRDRNFLIQSLLLPVILVGSQLMLSGSADAVADMASSPRFLAGMASGIASYMLMLSAFQTLHNEGQSLWMLYTFPRPIESILREKAQFWAVLALIYPIVLLAAGLWFSPATAAKTLELFVVVLIGVPIFSVVAVALGVFGCDPLAQDARTKIKPSYAYLYMLLSGMLVYAISTPQWPLKLVIIILLCSLAVALWQKARDHLPYLLDPAAAPPARVSTADGLIAAALFFILQGALALGFIKLGKLAPGDAFVLAFSIAGLLVYVIMRFVYLLLKTQGVPVMLPTNAGKAAAIGIGAGLAAALLGIAYLAAVRAAGLFPEALAQGAGGAFRLQLLFALAVIAAPLAEEFIFRGLVFGGLRRSMGLAASMIASAALFAIVHPPVSMLPVFVLGLGAALAYERTRSLLAPVLMHAVYNAAVISYQVFA